MKKKGKPEIDSAIDIFDRLSGQSLDAGQSKEEWLDTLREIRDELDIQIENVEREIEDD